MEKNAKIINLTVKYKNGTISITLPDSTKQVITYVNGKWWNEINQQETDDNKIQAMCWLLECINNHSSS